MKSLAECMQAGPFFIWTDIDGGGDRWYLAFATYAPSRLHDSDQEQIFFPLDDFHDYAENYEDCPAVPIETPPPPPPSPRID